MAVGYAPIRDPHAPTQIAPVEDPTDPRAAKIAAWRKEGTAAGHRVDATDANILADQDFQAWTPGTGNTQFTSGSGPRDQALSQVSSAYSGGSAPGADLRSILMTQLGAAGQAPTANDPGIRDVLGGQRLALQRSAERQQGLSAEQRAVAGLRDSGAAETQRLGIEQARGEADARMTGDVLGGELDARRRQLLSLLGLGIQDDQFADTLGFNYGQMNQQANLQALLALLGAA